MEFKSKFDTPNDTVWFINQNKIMSGVVIGICVSYGEFPIGVGGKSETIFPPCFSYQVGNMRVLETSCFSSKQELIDSLSKE